MNINETVKENLDWENEVLAAAAFYDTLIAGRHPITMAEAYAKSRWKVVLMGNQLNRIMELYATTGKTIEGCVDAIVKQTNPNSLDKIVS